MSDSSRHLITPRDEFSILCTWVFLEHFTRKDPSLNLLVLLRVPAIAWKPFCTAQGDSLLNGRSSLADLTTIKLGQLSFVRKSSLSVSESESSSVLVGFCCCCCCCLLFGKAHKHFHLNMIFHHVNIDKIYSTDQVKFGLEAWTTQTLSETLSAACEVSQKGQSEARRSISSLCDKPSANGLMWESRRTHGLLAYSSVSFFQNTPHQHACTWSTFQITCP